MSTCFEMNLAWARKGVKPISKKALRSMRAEHGRRGGKASAGGGSTAAVVSRKLRCLKLLASITCGAKQTGPETGVWELEPTLWCS